MFMSSLPSSSRESKPKKTSKRIRTVLSIAQKLEIIAHLDKGKSVQCLMKRFGVGQSTIFDVKYNKESILAFASQMDSKEGSTKRKTMKLVENEKLEEAMYVWFIQRRGKGDPISGPMVCEKTLLMNEKLGGPKDFKASHGWLHNFKSHHGIHELDVQGERLSVMQRPPRNSKIVLWSCWKRKAIL